jgi:hypothetical protein
MEQKLYIYNSKKESIMTTVDLRETVREYINTADIRLLKMMKALVETYQKDERETSAFYDTSISDLKQRAEASLRSIEKGETRPIQEFKSEVDSWKNKKAI